MNFLQQTQNQSPHKLQHPLSQKPPHTPTQIGVRTIWHATSKFRF